jgi:hypothetical protein
MRLEVWVAIYVFLENTTNNSNCLYDAKMLSLSLGKGKFDFK